MTASFPEGVLPLVPLSTQSRLIAVVTTGEILGLDR